jgi:uncharacterized protein YciI
MKRSILCLLFAACLAMAAGAAAQTAQVPQKPAPRAAGPQRFQLVLLKLGPAWQKGKPLVQQPGIQERATYIQKLTNEGTLVIAGPLFDDKNQIFKGGMMVLALATPEDAQQTVAADPAVKSDLFQIERIETMIITSASWRPSLPKK